MVQLYVHLPRELVAPLVAKLAGLLEMLTVFYSCRSESEAHRVSCLVASAAQREVLDCWETIDLRWADFDWMVWGFLYQER